MCILRYYKNYYLSQCHHFNYHNVYKLYDVISSELSISLQNQELINNFLDKCMDREIKFPPCTQNKFVLDKYV